MKRLSSNAACVLFVIAAFAAQIFLVPSSAEARWREGETPGSDFPTELVIVAGVLIAVAIVVVLVKKSRKEDKKEETEEKEEESSEENSDSQSLLRSKEHFGDARKLAAYERHMSRINFYLDVDETGEGIGLKTPVHDLSDKTVKMGLSFSF